jgi:hypothetical protein
MALVAGQIPLSGYQIPDYSGAAQAGQAYGAASTGPYNMISSIAQTAGDYFKQQGEKKKQVKMASTQIDAALKLMPELSPILGDVGNRLKDEDVSLSDRFADASVVPDLIKNSMSGFMSQQMMNLRQQKFAASQAQASGGGATGGGAPAQGGFVVQ